MRLLLSLFALGAVLLLADHDVRRPAAAAQRAPATELLIFEHPQCTYCQVFREQVLPKYHIAARISAPPLRFVDVAKDDTDSLGLSGRIATVPTAVVMRGGREVGRIEGYWSSANFFRMLAHILDEAG